MFMLFISLKKIYMPSKNEQKLLTSAFEKFIMFLMPEYIRVTFMKTFLFTSPFSVGDVVRTKRIKFSVHLFSFQFID